MGGPTTRERDILRKHAGAVDPDRIVVGFCLNDPQPRSQDHSLERERFDRGPGRFARTLAGRLAAIGLVRVGDTIHSGIYRLAEMAGVIPPWQVAMQRSYEAGSADWRAFLEALEEIKTISDERGLPEPIFAILNQGTLTDRPTDYRHPDEALRLYLDWYHRAEEAARRAGYATYNHEEEIAARLRHEPLAVNLRDGHPSAHVNRIYGQKLFVALTGQHSLDSSVPAARRSGVSWPLSTADSPALPR